ncbi:MAG: hypothetical protein IPI25_04880 [Candidatus Brocadia sp.]|nr:MAG: hypothetical protein IPI25_04880 [Candidatus Brocadia sp.]
MKMLVHKIALLSLIFITFTFMADTLSAKPWKTETVAKEKYSQYFYSKAIAIDKMAILILFMEVTIFTMHITTVVNGIS